MSLSLKAGVIAALVCMRFTHFEANADSGQTKIRSDSDILSLVQASGDLQPTLLLTQLLAHLEDIVEARCVWFLHSFRLRKLSAVSGRKPDLSDLPERLLLTRDHLRELLRVVVQEHGNRVVLLDNFDVLEGNIRMARINVEAYYYMDPTPYSDIISERLSEADQRLLMILFAYYRAVLLEEFAEIVLDVARNAGDADIDEDVRAIREIPGSALDRAKRNP